VRLVQLELEGFTSFRDPTSIRFEGLELFAICGPTGAGKSSLLDAITFALYGRVERVGKSIGSLRSTGKGVLGVLLEFEAKGHRYRVTRKLRAAGTQKVLIERAEGDGWIDAGDGADKVAGVDALVQRILGIDYDGFVRTVVLPQGEFARFLNGDAAERRGILSKLLGLEVYERMMKRANALHLSLKDQATGKSQMLERSMADATPEVLAAVDGEIEEAIRALDAADQQRKLLTELAVRDAEHGTRHDAIVASLQRIDAFHVRLAEIGTHRTQLEAVAASSEPRLVELRAHADRTLATQRDLEAQLADLVADRGDDARLRSWRDAAQDLTRAGEQQEALDAARIKGLGALTEAEETSTALAARAQDVARNVEVAQDALDAAEHALETARRTDHAASACAGLTPGDPCPICATPLPDPLPVTAAPGLADATAARTEASRRRDEAVRAAADADTACHKHEATIERYRERLGEIEHGIADAVALGDRARTLLAGAFEVLPDDPATVLERELTDREARRSVIDTARVAAADAVAALRALEDGTAALDKEAEGLRARELEVRASLGPALAQTVPAELLPATISADLLAASALDAAGVEDLQRALTDALDPIREQRATLLEDAATLAGAAVASIADAARAHEDLRAGLDRDLGRARGRREAIATQIELRESLQREVADIGASADRYRAVAEELRSNRFVEYLQHDALRSLCLAGNEQLRRLSGERYKLVYEDGGFAVLDAWSADEQRSAKTLSGGETFLASLSLALSLADEIARVRIGDSARLESLFLDEGFGTLDTETLQEVEEALDRLARTGRTIGVITHIKELAERFPVRIQVTKHQTGSTVEILG
jgi:exonuclease SbcC